MPELPEVETIRRDLEKLVLDKNITKVEVIDFKKTSPVDFVKRLRGLNILKLEKLAKLLVFGLSDGSRMLVHLKMTGQLIYRERGGKIKAMGGHPIAQNLRDLPNKFTHVIFTFADGSHLFFNDVRKFGYLRIVTNQNEYKRIFDEYGVEPLNKEFTSARLKEIIQKRPKMKIKQLLMDQTMIAGIGNIYSDEACFYAGIEPRRKAGSLIDKEIKKLRDAILKVLRLSIAKRGTSADDYVDAYGRKGEFVPYLKVYGRTGEKCRKCQTELRRVKVGGRTSHFCPQCQI